MPLAPRLSLQSAAQFVVAGHIGLLLLITAFHRNVAMAPHSHWSNDSWLTYHALVGGFFIAQVCLIAWWAGISGMRPTWRVIAIAGFVPILALAQSSAFDATYRCGWWRADPQETVARYITWVVALTSFAVLVSLAGIVIRLCGFCLAAADEEAPREAQFTLQEAGFLIAFLAVCLATGRWLVGEGLSLNKVWVVARWTLEETIAPLEFAALGCFLAGLVFSPVHWKWILIALPIVFGLVDGLRSAGWFEADSLHTPAPWRTFELFYFSFALTLVATLLVFRDRGFRWVRGQSKHAPHERSP